MNPPNTIGILDDVEVQFIVENANCVLVPISIGLLYVHENISIVFELPHLL